MVYWGCNWKNSCGDGLLTFRLNSDKGCLEISILLEMLESPRIPQTTEMPDYRQSQGEPLLAWGMGSSQSCQEANISHGPTRTG